MFDIYLIFILIYYISNSRARVFSKKSRYFFKATEGIHPSPIRGYGGQAEDTES